MVPTPGPQYQSRRSLVPSSVFAAAGSGIHPRRHVRDAERVRRLLGGIRAGEQREVVEHGAREEPLGVPLLLRRVLHERARHRHVGEEDHRRHARLLQLRGDDRRLLLCGGGIADRRSVGLITRLGRDRSSVLLEAALHLVDVDDVLDVDRAERALLRLHVVAAERGLLPDQLLADHLDRVVGGGLGVALSPPVRRLRERLLRGGGEAEDVDLGLGHLGVEHVEGSRREIHDRERLLLP